MLREKAFVFGRLFVSLGRHAIELAAASGVPLNGLCLQRGQRNDPIFQRDSIRGKRLAKRIRRFLRFKPQSLVFSIAPLFLPLTPRGQAVVKNRTIVLANDDAPQWNVC